MGIAAVLTEVSTSSHRTAWRGTDIRNDGNIVADTVAMADIEALDRDSLLVSHPVAEESDTAAH